MLSQDNVNKIKKEILEILKPYKNMSYFNIKFYNIIKDVPFTAVKKDIEIDNFIFLKENILSIKDYHYVIIYNALFEIIEFNYNVYADKREFVKDLYSELTYYKCISYRDYDTMFFNIGEQIFVEDKNDELVKFYNLTIEEDVVNCNDYSNDTVIILPTIDICFDKIKILKKNIYTITDIKILSTAIKQCYDWYDISYKNNVIQYCMYIIQYCKLNNNKLLEHDCMQANIQSIILMLSDFCTKDYMKTLMSALMLGSINKIIDRLPIYVFSYIPKNYKEILIEQYRDNLGILLKLSAGFLKKGE